MKAVTWQGAGKMQVDTVPDPVLINPRDAIVQVTTTCICGSDLHLYDGFMPTMRRGDIMGHEFMGIVTDVGREVKHVRKGDRVVVTAVIACGHCYYCEHEQYGLCDNTNPNASAAEAAYGYGSAALFGYSHVIGGYAGGQAEYVRVPYADVNCYHVPEDLPDEQAVFLTDIFPTGFQAAYQCDIKPSDIIAVWGCGPVGQFTIRSAFLLGAKRVIAIDRFPDRLKMAENAGAEILNYEETPVLETLKLMTAGRGPDAVIDAVGMEAHGTGPGAAYDRIAYALRQETDRPTVLRQAIQACRKGGVVSIPGVYGGMLDKVPFGAAFNKGLIFKMGQTHMHRWLKPLTEHIQAGNIDPSFVITHTVPLDRAPEMYRIFRDKEDGCVKVVLKPGMM